MGTRHKWTLINRLEHVTIRQCSRCGMFKNTRHEGDRHWAEFVLECEPVDSTPARRRATRGSSSRLRPCSLAVRRRLATLPSSGGSRDARVASTLGRA
jgi:hypothetical protein